MIYQSVVSVLESPLFALSQIYFFGNAIEHICGLFRSIQSISMPLQLNDLLLILLQLSLVCIRLRFGNTTLNLTYRWAQSTLFLLI